MIVSLVMIHANCVLLFYLIDHFCLFVTTLANLSDRREFLSFRLKPKEWIHYKLTSRCFCQRYSPAIDSVVTKYVVPSTIKLVNKTLLFINVQSCRLSCLSCRIGWFDFQVLYLFFFVFCLEMAGL